MRTMGTNEHSTQVSGERLAHITFFAIQAIADRSDESVPKAAHRADPGVELRPATRLDVRLDAVAADGKRRAQVLAAAPFVTAPRVGAVLPPSGPRWA